MRHPLKVESIQILVQLEETRDGHPEGEEISVAVR